jgi:hypothetical protein
MMPPRASIVDAGQHNNVPSLPCLWGVSPIVRSRHPTGVAQIGHPLKWSRHVTVPMEAPVKLQGSKGLGLTINVVSEDSPVTTATFYLMQSSPERLWWGSIC